MIGLIPETAEEMLANYDRGEPVFTIEMGGLGPGYEQCIQMLAMEIIRDRPGPVGGNFQGWADKTVSRTDGDAGGYSGAQVEAAKWLAYHLMTEGPKNLIERFPSDRRIQVSKFFPSCPKC